MGDRQPYLFARLTLDPAKLDELATAAGVEEGTLEALATNPTVAAHLQARIEELCNAEVARYQTIERIRLPPVEFSVDGGELPPTMKMKRAVVGEEYAEAIASIDR